MTQHGVKSHTTSVCARILQCIPKKNKKNKSGKSGKSGKLYHKIKCVEKKNLIKKMKVGKSPLFPLFPLGT
jgi:hypothetical protein